jgi:DNA-binding MarR family transcriptional regulator
VHAVPRPLPAGVPANRRTRLANRLNSAAIHLLRRIARHDGADGVTPARLSALSVLVYGKARTVGELARRQSVSLPTVSRMVDALVREGLVTRTEDPADRRSQTLEVTRRGRELMERGRSRRIRELADELRALDATELTALEQGVAALERLEVDRSRDDVRTSEKTESIDDDH